MFSILKSFRFFTIVVQVTCGYFDNSSTRNIKLRKFTLKLLHLTNGRHGLHNLKAIG